MENSKLVLNELLVELFNRILKIEEAALKAEGTEDLSMTEMHTIDAISDQGSRTMSEVSRDLDITLGTLTIGVDRLIRKGYAKKRRSEEDKRIVLVELTEKGQRAKAIHEAFHQDMIESVVAYLDPEEEQILIQSLSKLMVFFKEKYKI